MFIKPDDPVIQALRADLNTMNQQVSAIANQTMETLQTLAVTMQAALVSLDKRLTELEAKQLTPSAVATRSDESGKEL